MKSHLYSKKFFSELDEGSTSSARVILSIIKEYLPIKSAVDIGCGAGSWIKTACTALEIHPDFALGIDGEYAKSLHREFKNKFIYADLSNPLRINEKFDLAISLEVAEHLPETRAHSFIDDICLLSNAILFSAAIPGQGGTGHINEQWPVFWKKEFSRNGYDMFDLVRPRAWTDTQVAPWYAQNCFLFVRKDESEITKRLDFCKLRADDDWRLRLVHPTIFRMAACESAGAGRLLRAAPQRVAFSLKRRLAGLL